MEKQQNVSMDVDAGFLTKLAEVGAVSKDSAAVEIYQDYMQFIHWIQKHLVFPIDSDIHLSEEKIQTIILESYVVYPMFSLEERKQYILGLAIASFTEKKLKAHYLNRDTQREDVIDILQQFPESFHTTFALLAIKEGLEAAVQEEHYGLSH